jgi:hypothetical protein
VSPRSLLRPQGGELCTPFVPVLGGGAGVEHCAAVSWAGGAPCVQLSDGTFGTSDAENTLAQSLCSMPPDFCTFQPPLVKGLFIFFLSAFPGLCALLALWPLCRYPLGRAEHAELSRGIAAHKRGDAACDPLTGVLVPAPSSEVGEAAQLASYDHYSDAELRAAAAAASAGHDPALVLRGRIQRRLCLGAAGLGLLLAIALVGLASNDVDFTSSAITVAALGGSAAIFGL